MEVVTRPTDIKLTWQLLRFTFWLRRGLGIGAYADGVARWGWAGKLRCALSRHLRIGHWFHDGHDVCEVCDATPSDVDFDMVRSGFRRARCRDEEACHEVAVLDAKYRRESGG